MNPLQHLKDIYNPAPITFWPMAPGWYALIALVILTIAISFIIVHRRKKKSYVKKIALNELQSLRDKVMLNADANIIEELSILLRRAALIQYSRQEIASLHDEAWLAFLDKTAHTNLFTTGVGQSLAKAPYQKNPTINYPELIDLIETWIKQLR